MTAKITEVRDGIVAIVPEQEKGSAWQSPNLYLVGKDRPTLIDAGYDKASNTGAVMEALGGRGLERIILTHGHIDHAGGAWFLREKTGAPVLAHADEAEAIQRRFPGKKIDGHIEARDKLAAGLFTLEAVLLPGHARGHLALLIAEEKIFFSGDLITGDGSSLVAPPEGNMKRYMDSLKKVRAINLDLILPGHGPIVTDPAKRVAQLIEHRELREICIVKCLVDGPLDLKALVRAMYLGLIHPSLEFAAAGTAWAHLEKMIEEGNVESEPEGETNPFNRKFRLRDGFELPF